MMQTLMFWSRRPRPPLTTFQRVDIELLMRKNVRAVGREHAVRSTVVGSVSQLRLDASDPARLIDTARAEVEGCMPPTACGCAIETVDADRLRFASTYEPSQDGQPATIRIADNVLGDSLRTVMELAYQCANHFWHSIPGASPLDLDPRTTNLLPVCCGLGILASDASLQDNQWSQAGWTGWSMSRCGYYTAAEIGYALALLARLRGEVKPAWAGGLRPDSRDTFAKAQRYFQLHQQQGGQLLFDADRVPSPECDFQQLAGWLAGDDLAFALAAGYALQQRDDLAPRVMEAALAATRSGDKDLVPVATRLLGRGRRSDDEAEHRVGQLIRHASPHVRLAAIESASALDVPLTPYAPVISRLLDFFAEDALGLIEVIGHQGRALECLAPKICQQISVASGNTDDELASALLECLQRITADPPQAVQTWIKPPEIRNQMLRRLSGNASKHQLPREYVDD